MNFTSPNAFNLDKDEILKSRKGLGAEKQKFKQTHSLILYLVSAIFSEIFWQKARDTTIELVAKNKKNSKFDTSSTFAETDCG